MIRQALRFFLLVLAMVMLSHCGNPCEELAQMTCQELGADSATCKKAMEKAKNADSREKANCDTATKLVESMKKQR